MFYFLIIKLKIENSHLEVYFFKSWIIIIIFYFFAIKFVNSYTTSNLRTCR